MVLRGDSAGFRPRVLFFDVIETMLDTVPLVAAAKEKLGGREALAHLWFSTMLHYSLVTTLGDRYRDFSDVGAATLTMVANANGYHLSPEDTRSVVSLMQTLAPHSDVKPGLEHLKKEGFRLVTLTNSSRKTVEKQMQYAELNHLFDAHVSSDEVGYFKPHLHFYRLAARKVGFKTSDTMLVAAHGWDVAGALWSGCRAAFIARPGKSLYSLADAPEFVAPNFMEFARSVAALQSVDNYTE